MPLWKDTTTYSRSNPNAPASQWSYENGPLLITVLNGHRHYPGKWMVVCRAVGIDQVVMKWPIETTPEEAQAGALRVVRKRLNDLTNLLPAL